MALARDKVVKLEPASRGTVQFREDTILLGEDENQSYFNKSILTGESSTLSTDGGPGMITAPTTTETAYIPYGDNLSLAVPERKSALPANWPNIASLSRRRSCELTKSASTCVNKATSHLELLQNIIEEWFKETEMDILSRASSRASRGNSAIVGILPASRGAPGSKKLFRFTPASPTAMSQGTNTESHSSGKQLSIQGVGGKADQGTKILAISEQDELPYLGAEEVVEEVVTLLARLDKDRQETEQNHIRERDKVLHLSEKINKLSMQKLHDMPVAVQQEHEACALDINELQWHVSYRGRIETRVQSKVDVADVLNTRLSDDIVFVKKHCPLVREKLELEVQAMEKVRSAQADTNEELDLTRNRCSKVDVKSQEAHKKANTERAHIKSDLDSVRDQLRKISEDLAEAKMMHNTYIHQSYDYRQQVKENNQELQVQEVKNENAKAAENMQATKVKDLQARIIEEDFEKKKLEEENFTLSTSLEKDRSTSSHKERDLLAAIEIKNEKLKRIRRKNQDRELDIDDYIKKMNECEKQAIADQKNLERMGKELRRTESLAEVTQQDLQDVLTINSAIKEKLQSEEERCIMAEEGLKSSAEALKRQVREEIHARTVLMARIGSDGGEMNKNQEDSWQKKEKIGKKAEEVQNAVKVVLSKVEKLREIHAEKTKQIKEMRDRISELEKLSEELKEKTDGERNTLQPEHNKAKSSLTDVEKQQDYMQHKTEMMDKNLEDMAASTRMMTRVMDTTQKAIDTLTAELEEVTIQHEAATKIGENLKFSVEQINCRVDDTNKRHKTHIGERKRVLELHQKELKESKKKNKEVAAKYRQLQNEVMELKNKYMNCFDQRVNVESAIKDLKQLQGLQQRMRASMMEYYKYRGLYNQSELGRMEKESNQNGVTVGRLQTEMDDALENISHFLQTEMEGGASRKITAKKMNTKEKPIRGSTRVSVTPKTTVLATS